MFFWNSDDTVLFCRRKCAAKWTENNGFCLLENFLEWRLGCGLEACVQVRFQLSRSCFEACQVSLFVAMAIVSGGDKTKRGDAN